MIPSYCSAVLVLVTVLLNSRSVSCTHFNASSVATRREDRPVRVDNVNSPNSFSGDSSNAKLDGNLENFPLPISASYSISPSLSYQFHTNKHEHEHLDKIVLGHHNSVRNSFSSETSLKKKDAVSSYVSTGKVENGKDDGSKGREGNFPRDSVNANNNPNPTYDSSTTYQAQHQEQKQQQKTPATDVHRTRGDWQQGKQEKQKQQEGWQYHHQPSLPGITTYSQSQNNVQVGSKRNSNPYGKPAFGSNQLKSTSNQTTHQEKSRTHDATIVSQYQSRMDTPASIVYSSPLTNENGISNLYRQNSQTKPQMVASVLPYAKFRFENTTPSQLGKQKIAQTKASRKTPTSKGKSGKRKILTSRADSYANDDDDDEDDDGTEDDDNGDNQYNQYYQDHRQGLYESENDEANDQDNETEQDDDDDDNAYYYNPDGGFPQIRDLPTPGNPGNPFPPPGAGPPGPFPPPPPPPPLKGAVDYILIPLILIGIAGPIFVVLYVILGGFEYKIAPISRSLKQTDYQPYIDAVSTSVGRALEKYECYEYAACRARGLYNRVGLTPSTTATIEETLNFVTPKEYESTVKTVFSSLTKSKQRNESCFNYQCSDMVNYFL